MRLSIILALLHRPQPPLDAAFAQLAGTGDFHIVWEVKNRFRLFRNEADFLRQVAASRGDGVLAAEQRLERDTDGLGWAKDVVANLCLDNSGDLLETCERDGVRENYLAPRRPSDRRDGCGTGAGQARIASGVSMTATGRSGRAPRRAIRRSELRVRSGRTTVATVDIPLGDGTAQRVSHRDRGARRAHCRARRFHRRRRRQSGQGGGAGRRLLLQALSARRRQPIFPAEPRRLRRRPVLRKRAVEPDRGERLGAPRRALDESGLPPFALQLSGAHRARARDRAAAHRRDPRSARLHRGDDRRRHVRRPARRRLPLGGGHRDLLRHRARAICRTEGRHGRGASPGSQSQSRSGAADGRRQRREFRRAGRQRHRRCDHRAAFAQTGRRHRRASPIRRRRSTRICRTNSRNCARR